MSLFTELGYKMVVSQATLLLVRNYTYVFFTVQCVVQEPGGQRAARLPCQHPRACPRRL